jgi:hypothetical protein
MVTRLIGGLSPANGADPRTFPLIWNATADVIEQTESDVSTIEDDITALDGRVTTNESDITALDGRVTTNEGDIAALETPLACKATFVSVDFNSSATYAKVSAFNTTALLNETGFTLASGGITVPSAGLYFVSFNIELTSAGQRVAPIVALGVNNSVDTSLVAAHTYIRNLDSHDTTSANAAGLVRLSASDVLELFAKRGGSTTTATNSTASVGSFNIFRVGN